MQSKYNVLDLNKELAQSKINFDLDDINNQNKFLETKVWDCLDDNKILELDKKVEDIYKGLNKEHIKNIEKKINDYNFDEFYKSYNPKQNIFKIGALCDLNCLVESTYMNEITEKEKMDDLEQMGLYIFKFRNILGDGECFYRGLIFSILENIILMNNIMQMKELLILFHEKINLNNKLINEKEYLKVILFVNIDEILEILYLLIIQMEKSVQTAYTSLLKLFIFNQDFEFGIIIFTRYLLYEYISENEDKIYSKEYHVEVGCLLPDEYIINKEDKNEYYFENFFSEHLMNPKTFAEKIVVYIAPYVFNIYINILVYDFGVNGRKSVITEKKFNNEKENNFQCQINLLFRKIHYDVYYKYEFFEDYKKYLNILENKFEDINLLEQLQLEQALHENNIIKNNNSINVNSNSINDNNNSINVNNNSINDNNNSINVNNNIIINDSNNFNNNNINIHENNNIQIENKINVNKKDEQNINKHNIDNNSDFSIFNKNDVPLLSESQIFKNDMNKINNIPPNNNQINKNINNNLPVCLECHNNYEKEDYLFGLCDSCLLIQLKTLLHVAFLEFLKNPENLINSVEKLRNFLKEKKCKISIQEDINLYEAIYNSKFNFNKIFADVRKTICLFCGENLKNQGEYYIELPCKCRLCCEQCFNKYSLFITTHITLKDQKHTSNYKYLNLLSCYCGFDYNTQNVLYMIEETNKRNLLTQKKMYSDYIDNFWNWRCCMCKKNFTSTKSFYKFIFLCDKIKFNLLNPNIGFKHLICNDCYLDYNINQIKIINCNICELEHNIIELNKVNGYNEEINMNH